MAPKRKRDTEELDHSMTPAQALQLEATLLMELNLDAVYPDLPWPVRQLSLDKRNELRHEYIRFIVLKVYLSDFKATMISPPVLVDQLWHAHLQESLDYFDMCYRLCKADYIHHRSSGSRDGQRVKRLDFARGAYAILWPKDAKDNWIWEERPDDPDTPMSSEIETDPHLIRASTTDSGIGTEGETDTYDGRMNLFFKTVCGRTLTIGCFPSDRMSTLKEIVQRHTGLPPELQRFIWQGKHLEDGRILSDYTIPKDSTIHVNLRLRGC